MRPISTDTGRSGRLNPLASVAGSPVSSVSGARVTMISFAESSLTTTSPDNSEDLLQSSVNPLRVIHTPLASAMVMLSAVACDDKAPANPVIVTVRPAPERLSSRNAVR